MGEPSAPSEIHPLPRWQLRTRTLLPVVQGGMGVGISAHRLAGSVARAGALGTISSVDLRHHHPDLLERAEGCTDRGELDKLNLIALDREIRMAVEIAGGHGAIAVNVMKAVSEYAAYVRQSCASGAHAIVMGAGLPFWSRNPPGRGTHRLPADRQDARRYANHGTGRRVSAVYPGLPSSRARVRTGQYLIA